MEHNQLRKHLTLVVFIVTLTVILIRSGSVTLAQTNLVERDTRTNNAIPWSTQGLIADSSSKAIVQLMTSVGQSQKELIAGPSLSATPVYAAGHQPATEDTVKYSPNGQYVAFLEYLDDRNYETKLVIINSQDGIVERIIPGSSDGFPSNPLWSPDSNYLAYVWYEPGTASISLWIVRIADFSVKRLETGTSFWPVLVYGITDAVVWEPDSTALQYLDERIGKVFRVELMGNHSEMDPSTSLIPSGLITGPDSNAPVYSGMVKPLDIRDYDGTCGNGYSGLHPTYTCTSSASHPAVDMSGGPTQIGCGTPVVASCDGVVVRTETYGLGSYSACGNNVGNPNQGFANLGWQVTLKCNDIPNASLGGTTYGGTIYVTYAHLSEIQSGIANNVAVTKGQVLGKVGSTGYSSAPHLHFQMDKDNSPYHPFYPSPYPVDLVLERTWNPMYFIQAHGQNACCACSRALASASSSTFQEIFAILGPHLEETEIIADLDNEENMSSLIQNMEVEEGVGGTPQLSSSSDLGGRRNPITSGNISLLAQPSIRAEIELGLPSSTNFQIVHSVMGMGGGVKTSSSYVLLGTSGQPFATGLRTSSNYRLNSGYWGAPITTPTPMDTPTPTATLPPGFDYNLKLPVIITH